MKTIFCIISCLFCINCFSQSVIVEWPLRIAPKGVKIIENKSPRGSVTSSFYSIDRYLVRETYKNRGKIRTDRTIEYQRVDTLLIAKTNETLNFYEKEEDYDKSVKKIFLSNGKYKRFEIYHSEKDTEPYIVADNFIYEGSLLMSYDWSKYSENEEVYTVRIKNKYNDERQLIQVHYCNSDPKMDTFIVYQYNDKGQLTDRIKIIPDYLGTFDASSLLGEDFSGEQKMSKRHTVYSGFDAQGNWTTSFYIMKNGEKKTGYKRKIKYYQ